VELVPYFLDAPEPAKIFHFDGHVDIKVRAEQPVSKIVMHSLDIEIETINVTQVLINN